MSIHTKREGGVRKTKKKNFWTIRGEFGEHQAGVAHDRKIIPGKVALIAYHRRHGTVQVNRAGWGFTTVVYLC